MAKAKSIVKKSQTARLGSSLGQPPKALPVTLLSGFLGSGKTTLLQHILRSEHGLRIAVIVNDIGEINVDAALIRQTHRLTKTQEKVIALQNGCICCTLRGDLLEELVRLAELAAFDYIIVESSGISEPEQVAETFDQRLAEQMGTLGETAGPELGLDENMMAVLQKIKKAGGLDQFARLDTTVTVIDAFTIFHDFETTDLLSSRRGDVEAEDERSVSDLMVDQIEFADVIVLNKTELIDTAKRGRVRDLITKLNHRAKVIETSFGKLDVKQIVNTGMFNLEVAQTGYGWLQDLHAMTLREVNGRKAVTPKPETEEYNVRNFVYTRRRPFHPRRLFELIHDKFILQQQFEDDDEDVEMDVDNKDEESPDEMETEGPAPSDKSSNASLEESHSDSDASRSSATTAPSEAHLKDTPELEIPDPPQILANKRADPLFNKLFRSKGEFWLATRPLRAGEWSQAGGMLTMQGGRPWFCVIDRSEWETGNKEIDELVEYDMQFKWGDRRQELVFIGENLNIKGIEEVLDACLLDDQEWAKWEQIMDAKKNNDELEIIKQLSSEFEDGWPEWLEDEEDQHEHAGHHDHAHGHTSRPKHLINDDGVVR